MDALVKTRQGEVRGCVIDNVRVFKGIPYAARIGSGRPSRSCRGEGSGTH